MALKRELIKILDDPEKPLQKKLKIANSAFRSSEFPLNHKEAILIQWTLRNLSGESSSECLRCLNGWLKSNQFEELTRNEVDNEEIRNIVEVFKEKLLLFEDVANETTLLECVDKITQNRIFQQYFKFNTDEYCRFVAVTAETFKDDKNLSMFLSGNLFPKELIGEEKFLKAFLKHVMPCLVSRCIKFNTAELFNQISTIIKKCVFLQNLKPFATYLNRFFEAESAEKQPKPKLLMKHLLNAYNLNNETAVQHFKLSFHAFATAHQTDFDAIFKFFAILIHMLGFDLNQKMLFHRTASLQQEGLTLSKSQSVIHGLLEVLTEVEVDLKSKVKEVTFSEFLTNVVVEFIRLKLPSGTVYNIFVKAMALDPMMTEALVEEVLIMSMMADNTKHKAEYEALIISIFDTYTKLHRIGNMVYKMTHALNDGFNGETTKINELYGFTGKIDVQVTKPERFKIEEILTDEICNSFSKCICGLLLPWQVFNIFYSLLHLLNEVLGGLESVDNGNTRYFTFLGILSKLLCVFLSSIRVTERSFVSATAEKYKKCLEELEKALKVFGGALVKREHNQNLMWSFLNIAFHWAEISIVLRYYSLDSYNSSAKDSSSEFNALKNVTYLHPYLSAKQWYLLSERITNFGEKPCNQLLHKLYIQTLKALRLFEGRLSDDVVMDLVRILNNLEDHWQDIFEDRFVVDWLPNTSVFRALIDVLVSNSGVFSNGKVPDSILDSPRILNAINVLVLTRINKLMSKHKKRYNLESLSVDVFATFDTELLLDNNFKFEVNGKDLELTGSDQEWKVKEDKLCGYLDMLIKYPAVYVDAPCVHESCLFYLVALHRDLSCEFSKGNLRLVRERLESIIIGILQECKLKPGGLFRIDKLCLHIMDNFELWEEALTLISDNLLTCLEDLGPFVERLSEKLLDPVYMGSSFIVMNSLNKGKMYRLSKDRKAIADKYKTTICNRIIELVKSNQPSDCLLKGFVYALRNYFVQKTTTDPGLQSELPDYIDTYIDYALSNLEDIDNTYLGLFVTILEHKAHVTSLKEESILRVWDTLRPKSTTIWKFDEYPQFVALLVTHVPDEQFSIITKDLLDVMQRLATSKETELFRTHLKTWEAVISCNFKSSKVKVLQATLTNLWREIIALLETVKNDRSLQEGVAEFHKAMTQATFLHLTPSLTDLLLLTVDAFLLPTCSDDFETAVPLSISMLHSLLQHRRPSLSDRLPSYLQRYRRALDVVCEGGRAEPEEPDRVALSRIEDCAHRLEKLTGLMTATVPRDMARIAMYLIADILGRYERVTLYPTVRVHLNNCLYSLISLCDQHAVSYLFRVLSSASTEMFKIEYENYKKYYKFTGKV